MQANQLTKYTAPSSILKKIYDNIQKDIVMLLKNPNRVDIYRVVLGGRKSQINTVMAAISVERLKAQFEGAKGQKRTARAAKSSTPELD